MGPFTIFLVFINLIAILVFTALGIASMIKRKKDIEEDNPIIINFMANRSNGYAIGVELESKLAKNGRTFTTITPRDVPFKDINNLENQHVIIDKGGVISLPKGEFSGRKNMKIYLSENADDYPKAFKNTLFGKALQLVTALNNSDNVTIAAMQEGSKRMKQHLLEMGNGEISIERMTQISEIFDDMFKLTNKKNSSGSPVFPNKKED